MRLHRDSRLPAPNSLIERAWQSGLPTPPQKSGAEAQRFAGPIALDINHKG
jgi:hypothetical protein